MNRLQIILAFLITSVTYAQNLDKQERIANRQMREGNSSYLNNKYADAEVAYKKAIATYPGNPKTIYNLANSIAQQERYKEAIKQYDYLAKSSKSNKMRAHSFHNIGNAYMGLKKLQKAIDFYKNALRINPKDEETRYNLAYAQDLLKQQQKQNKDNKGKDKNKDKDKKDKDKKDKKDKDKDKKGNKKDDKKKGDDKDKKNQKDKDEKKDGDKDKKDQPKDKDKPSDKDNKDKKKQQPRPGKLTPKQAEQLLKALENEEKKTQDKVNAKRVKGKKIKTEKDW